MTKLYIVQYIETCAHFYVITVYIQSFEIILLQVIRQVAEVVLQHLLQPLHSITTS